MNVALELIKRTFDVPKDVMHYIIAIFRPRPPSGELEWDSWVELKPDYFLWYNWELVICSDGGYNLLRSIDDYSPREQICGSCSRDIEDNINGYRLCRGCVMAYTEYFRSLEIKT